MLLIEWLTKFWQHRYQSSWLRRCQSIQQQLDYRCIESLQPNQSLWMQHLWQEIHLDQGPSDIISCQGEYPAWMTTRSSKNGQKISNRITIKYLKTSTWNLWRIDWTKLIYNNRMKSKLLTFQPTRIIDIMIQITVKIVYIYVTPRIEIMLQINVKIVYICATPIIDIMLQITVKIVYICMTPRNDIMLQIIVKNFHIRATPSKRFNESLILPSCSSTEFLCNNLFQLILSKLYNEVSTFCSSRLPAQTTILGSKIRPAENMQFYCSFPAFCTPTSR